MLFFKISKDKNKKVFNEKMKSYEFRVEYLCNADSILFCSICYNDALNKLNKLKDLADETDQNFNYPVMMESLKGSILNCFDSALAKEIEKIIDDLVVGQDINRFTVRIQNLDDDYNANKEYFSQNGVELYNDFTEHSKDLINEYNLFFK